MLQPDQYRRLIKIAKFSVLLLTTVFIFYKLVFRYKVNELFSEFLNTGHVTSYVYLFIASALVFINWGLESVKWQRLINKHEPISLASSFKAVLSGVCLSIITPNQVGDFVGRVIHLQVLNKIRGSLITVIGHTAQVLVTCFFGLFAIWVLASYAGSWHPVDKLPVINFSFLATSFPLRSLLPIVFIAASALAIWAYLNLRAIYKYLHRFKWATKLEKYIDVFNTYNRAELFEVLVISFFRYTVFLAQYYLLLVFFDVRMEPLATVCCIVATFCVQSMVPSFFLLEIGLRGASALWFFGMFSSNTPGILLAAYSLWIINMMIPALFGMWFIYRIK